MCRRLTGLLALSALAFYGLSAPGIQTGLGFAADDGAYGVADVLPVLPLLLPVGDLPSPEKIGQVLESSPPAIVTVTSRILAPRGPPARSLPS